MNKPDFGQGGAIVKLRRSARQNLRAAYFSADGVFAPSGAP